MRTSSESSTGRGVLFGGIIRGIGRRSSVETSSIPLVKEQSIISLRRGAIYAY